MEILIRPTDSEVAVTAADIMAGYIRRDATLGLATGSTPVKTYQELIRRHRQEGLSFARCRAFLLDEYLGLPKDHEQSYYTTIRREFTSQIDIDDKKVLSPEVFHERPQDAGKIYDGAIKAVGGIDIQLLGVGTDGHIGFNEPGSALNSGTRVKILHPQTVKDNSRFFGSEDEVPRVVMTQGLGTISQAGHLLLLATGRSKAEAVARFVEGPVSASCPASVLQFHRQATVVLDEAAASHLEHADYYRFAEDNKPDWLSL